MNMWKQHEQRTTQEAETNALRAQLEEELHPKRRFLHRVFIFLNICTIVAALLMGIGQILGIYLRRSGPIQYVLSIYVIILCVMVIFNELEFTKMLRESALLRIWITRGAVYAFVGILGLQENEAAGNANQNQGMAFRHQALEFLKVIAWIMIGLGILYFAMGVLCLQLVANRLRDDYQQRLERAKETRRATETYGGLSTNTV